MITIKTPERYINQADVLKSSGEYIAKLGKYALIVGGKTALSIAGKDLFSSLESSGVKFETKEFTEYPSEGYIDKYTEIVNELQVDLIIGVGGGKVLDLVKAVGERGNVPVVAVPTIAATCAAWSALTITYDDNGKYAGAIILNNSPKLVLADKKILAEAPVRYLNAGIGDTIVKWYEAAPYAIKGHNDIALRIGLQTAKLALDILKESAVTAAKERNETQAFTDVVDSIIILAGLVGSINGGNHRAAIAHAIHNSLTSIPDTHESLHGEKVIFGLIVQFVLEGKPQQEIDELIAFLNSLNLPVTLEQLGVKEDLPRKISEIAKGVNITKEILSELNFEVNSNLIEQALIKANQFGQSSLRVRNISGKSA